MSNSVDLAYAYLKQKSQVIGSLKSLSDHRKRQVAVSDHIPPSRLASQGNKPRPRKLARRLGQEVMDQIVKERLQGATYKALVRKYGVSQSSVQRLMRARGTNL